MAGANDNIAVLPGPSIGPLVLPPVSANLAAIPARTPCSA